MSRALVVAGKNTNIVMVNKCKKPSSEKKHLMAFYILLLFQIGVFITLPLAFIYRVFLNVV